MAVCPLLGAEDEEVREGDRVLEMDSTTVNSDCSVEIYPSTGTIGYSDGIRSGHGRHLLEDHGRQHELHFRPNFIPVRLGSLQRLGQH